MTKIIITCLLIFNFKLSFGQTVARFRALEVKISSIPENPADDTLITNLNVLIVMDLKKLKVQIYDAEHTDIALADRIDQFYDYNKNFWTQYNAVIQDGTKCVFSFVKYPPGKRKYFASITLKYKDGIVTYKLIKIDD